VVTLSNGIPIVTRQLSKRSGRPKMDLPLTQLTNTTSKIIQNKMMSKGIRVIGLKGYPTNVITIFVIGILADKILIFNIKSQP
jgi:hypothetical protein